MADKRPRYPQRNYGLGDPTDMLTSTPTVSLEPQPPSPCPSCGCDRLFMIHVDVKCAQLKGDIGIGSYVGCPACPWASPMMIIACSLPDAPPSRDNPHDN